MGTVRVRVRREKRLEFVQTMDDLMDLLRAQRGCSSYRFYMDNEDWACFELVSEWSDVELFEQHLTSAAFRVFRGSRPLLSDDPEAHLDFMSRSVRMASNQVWRFES